MITEQPSTGELSRDSTVFREIIEPVQFTTASPASVMYAAPFQTASSQINDDLQAQPSKFVNYLILGWNANFDARNFAQHVITLEHGIGLRTKCMIHEAVLCSHSQHMKQISIKAETLRDQYQKAEDVLEYFESIAMVELTPEQYDAQNCGAKVSSIDPCTGIPLLCHINAAQLLTLINTIENKYAIQEYQKTLSKAINAAIDLQFSNKNVLKSDKVPKSYPRFRELSLTARLSCLNSEGVLEVAQEVCIHLQRIKATEKQKAKQSVNKAWAQGRLLLRGASEKSVQLFVHWAYHAALPYDDAEHLYDLWGLATRLKADALAKECLNELNLSAMSSIQNALANGVPLRNLLGLSMDHNTPDLQALSDDFVKTIFHHVLKDQTPPPQLSNLVIDTMARHMDFELWAKLEVSISENVALQLIGRMVAYREINIKQDDKTGKDIKLDTHSSPNDNTPSVKQSY